MKNAKVDDKSKFLLSVMAAILIVAASFFLGYRNLEEKAKKLEAQNAELETTSLKLIRKRIEFSKVIKSQKALRFLFESLILAQDERWRRA